MNTRTLNRTLTSLLAAAALILSACTTTVPEDTNAGANGNGNSSNSTNVSNNPNITTTNPGRNTQGSIYPELTDPRSVLSKRSVYFDFDSYVVQPQYVALVQAHADFLKSHKDARILIQGNTDERGSSEYNLALGQKRADAVRKNMMLLGIPESQIESVSLGKEKPKNFGHDEEAWAENRRADILYNGEY